MIGADCEFISDCTTLLTTDGVFDGDETLTVSFCTTSLVELSSLSTVQIRDYEKTGKSWWIIKAYVYNWIETSGIFTVKIN